jgi:hypothetical protein
VAFSSPLLDPENLRLVSDPTMGRDALGGALVSRVSSRLKPLAFIDDRRKRPLTALESLAREAGLASRFERYVFTDGPRPVAHYFLSVAITDVIGDAVDLDALALEYSRRLPKYTIVVEQIALELERLRPMRFSDFLEFRDAEVTMQSIDGREGYSVYEYARTGLLFGYPVESTCDLMVRMYEERMTFAARERS